MQPISLSKLIFPLFSSLRTLIMSLAKISNYFVTSTAAASHQSDDYVQEKKSVRKS